MKEIDYLFRELNSLIDKTKRLTDHIQENWESKFKKDFLSKNFKNLIKQIDFLQLKYNIKEKIKTEEIFQNITNLFQIEKRVVEREKSLGLIESFEYLIEKSKSKKPKVKIEKEVIVEGVFISNPYEYFLSLSNGLLNIYHKYFRKYCYSKLDATKINFFNMFKLTFLKSWKTAIVSIFVGFIIVTGLIFLTAYVSTLFT